jgi:hypothetical protein
MMAPVPPVVVVTEFEVDPARMDEVLGTMVQGPSEVPWPGLRITVAVDRERSRLLAISHYASEEAYESSLNRSGVARSVMDLLGARVVDRTVWSKVHDRDLSAPDGEPAEDASSPE